MTSMPLTGVKNASSAGVKEGLNLNDDLQRAFGGEFEFRGSSCTHGSYENVPNPVMTIEGVGTIGIPLTDREARYIISSSSEHGGMDVDSEGAGCEIEPNRVSFQNPQWGEFVSKLASKTVWHALGAAQWKVQPRCELVKVSVHQPGSTVPALQASSSADGAFATMVIILPCTFEGGQVDVTYQGKTTTLDVSKSTILSTSVMAWYNEVEYNAKPLTSGYRVTLSYTIIHTSPRVPVPSLPKMEPAVERVRGVLQRWKEQKYTKRASMPLRVYLLSRHYGEKPHVSSLKGSDYHKVVHLIPLAKELGFVVSFATLTHVVEGYNHDVPLPPSPKRRKHEQKDKETAKVEVPVPPMAHIETTTTTVSDLDEISESSSEKPAAHVPASDETNAKEKTEKVKRLKDRLDFGKVEVQEDVVVPSYAFKQAQPDEKKYDLETYGTISHIYRRTAIVIYFKEDDTKLKLALKGDAWALGEIQRLSKHRANARKLALTLLEKLRVYTRTLYPSWKKNPDAETLRKLIQNALSWEDVELWKKAFPLCTNYCVKDVKGIVDNALEYFYVKDVLPSIKRMLHDTPSLTLRHRLAIVETVARYEDDEAVINNLMNDAFESYGATELDDTDTLLKLAKKKDFGVIHDVIIPKIAKRHGVANYFSTLLLALHEHRAEFEKSTGQVLTVSTVIRRCLQEYITQWNKLSTADLEMVQHITEVGMYVGEIKVVSDFLSTIPLLMGHPSEAPEWYNESVMPLMAKLRDLMKKLEEEVIGEDGEKVMVQPKITQEPFRSFWKKSVCVYLAYILGGKESVPSIPPLSVGCGCADCDELDEFIRGPEARCRFEAHLGEERLDHVLGRVNESKAEEIIDAFDDKSTAEPYSMILEKKREVVKRYTWAGRQYEAVKFMKHAVHGGEHEMKELLGKGAYECALRAIHGVRAFELSDGDGDGDSDTCLGDADVEEVTSKEQGRVVVDGSRGQVVNGVETAESERSSKRKREE